MGRINNKLKYPIDNIITLDDYVIGSDSDNNGKTKNYSVRGIISLALSQGNTTIRNGVLSGSVYWLQGLDFASTKIDYVFNNTLFQTEPQSPITLSDADDTNDRVDVFAIDVATNSVVVIEGVPSENPQEPTVDFASQIRLSSVIIEAQSTEPQGLTSEQVYNENLGEPSEWTLSTFIPSSGTINPDYQLDSSKDTKSILFLDSDVESLNNISFINDSIVTPSNITFDFKSVDFDGILYMSLIDSNGNQISSPISILNNSFGVDFTSGTYNTVSIPISSFGFTTGDMYGFQITVLPFRQKTSFLIDNILVQSGLDNTVISNNSFLDLIDTIDSYAGRGFDLLRVNKSATGVESVAIRDIFPAVALSGSYNDLDDKPVFPVYTLGNLDGDDNIELLSDNVVVSTVPLATLRQRVLDDVNIDNDTWLQFRDEDNNLMAQISIQAIKTALDLSIVASSNDYTDLDNLPDLPVKSDVIKLRKSQLPAGNTLEDRVVSAINNMNYNKQSDTSSLTIEIQNGIGLLDTSKINTSLGQMRGVGVSSDGLYIFIHRHNQSSRKVTLSEPFNPSSVVSNEALTSWQEGGWWIQDDGLRFAVLQEGNDTLFMYSGNTPYDFANFTLDSSFVLTGGQNTEVHFSPDGLYYFVRFSTSQIRRYDMTTPFDVSTSVFNSTLSVNGANSLGTQSMAVSRDMKRIYTIGTNTFREIELIESGVFTGAITRSIPADVRPAIPASNFERVTLSDDGSYMICSTYGGRLFSIQLKDKNILDELVII